MNLNERLMAKPGTTPDLTRLNPGATPGVKGKKAAAGLLKRNIDRLNELQYLLYAENKHAVLVVLQAMDAAGKDGTIRHVMAGLNPQGCSVTPFKVPSDEERDHDFLWRIHKAAPRIGEFGIFNRSHYEDVLVVRVHSLVPPEVWSKRYEQINAFEKLLADNGVTILKFFLHISKEEQKRRFRKRLEDPRKHWKLSQKDFDERAFWEDYMQAYTEALARCSTPWAPWYIIPSDRKWYRNLAVSQIIVEVLEQLDMQFPPPGMDVSRFRLE